MISEHGMENVFMQSGVSRLRLMLGIIGHFKNRANVSRSFFS